MVFWETFKEGGMLSWSRTKNPSSLIRIYGTSFPISSLLAAFPSTFIPADARAVDGILNNKIMMSNVEIVLVKVNEYFIIILLSMVNL